MIVKGQRGAVLQPVSHTWTPDRGFEYLPSYEGDINSVLNVAYNLRRNKIAYTLRNEGATGRVDINQNTPETGTAERPVGSWSLVGNQSTKDIFEHPRFKALSDDAKKILKFLRNGDFDDDPLFSDRSASDQATLGTFGALFYDLVFNQQFSYAIAQYVLKHNYTTSLAYSSALSAGNILSLYSKSQLIAECTNPNIVFDDPLPLMIEAEINNISEPASQNGYTWAWLKQPPTVSYEADDRISVSVEYWLEQWSDVLYG